MSERIHTGAQCAWCGLCHVLPGEVDRRSHRQGVIIDNWIDVLLLPVQLTPGSPGKGDNRCSSMPVGGALQQASQPAS